MVGWVAVASQAGLLARFFWFKSFCLASSFRSFSLGTVRTVRNAWSRRSHEVLPGTFGSRGGFI
jgi:hypothetical protein